MSAETVEPVAIPCDFEWQVESIDQAVSLDYTGMDSDSFMQSTDFLDVMESFLLEELDSNSSFPEQKAADANADNSCNVETTSCDPINQVAKVLTEVQQEEAMVPQRDSKPSKKRCLKKGPSSRHAKKPKGLPKRPISAYALFSKAERRVMQDSGKVIGKKWRELDHLARQGFEKLAEQDLQRYREEMSVYNILRGEINQNIPVCNEKTLIGVAKQNVTKEIAQQSSPNIPCDGGRPSEDASGKVHNFDQPSSCMTPPSSSTPVSAPLRRVSTDYPQQYPHLVTPDALYRPLRMRLSFGSPAHQGETWMPRPVTPKPLPPPLIPTESADSRCEYRGATLHPTYVRSGSYGEDRRNDYYRGSTASYDARYSTPSWYTPQPCWDPRQVKTLVNSSSEAKLILNDPKTGKPQGYKIQYKCYKMTMTQADEYINKCGGGKSGGPLSCEISAQSILHAPPPPGTEVPFPFEH